MVEWVAELYGYMGKILRVDLTRRRIQEEPLREEFAKKYIGTYGTGGRVLYDEVPPWVEPFDPLNRLIFSTGPVTGSGAQTAGRHTVVTKSPLTGYFGDASCGGFWGAELKFSGYDMIIFTGRSPQPVYLWVNDGSVEIREASSYWGMDARATERALRRDLGDRRIQISCIGQAGENLVRYAAVMHDEAGRAAGRCGVGAVMGFMKLKAVAVRGHREVPVADPEALRRLMAEIVSYYRKDEKVQAFHKGGTPAVFEPNFIIGDTPAFNWSNGERDYDPGKLAYPGGYEKVLAGTRTCHACAIACRRVSKAGPEGPYQVEKGAEGPEYETLAMLGSDCGVGEIYVVNRANELCNLYGLDTISTGAVVAFAMECYERGIIDKEDTGGVELKFGEAEALIDTIHKITFREGFGNLLAEGVRRASALLGKGSEQYAIHTKGLEIAAHDPRAFQGGTPHYACTPTGGRHTEGITLPVETGTTYPEMGYPEVLDRFATEGKGLLAKVIQDSTAIVNAMGFCFFASIRSRYGGSQENLIKTYTAVTGIPLTLEEALRIGERIFNLKKAFNLRHGSGREEDTLPKRLLEEPNRRAGGSVAKLDVILPEYYRVRGWDPKTSKPTKEKLIELGLEDLIADLY